MISQETYLFFLLILSLIRLIGGGMFLDFYLKHRNRRFILITSGFIIFSISPLIQTFLPSLEDLTDDYSAFIDPFIILNSLEEYLPCLLFLFSELLTIIAVYLFIMVAFNYAITIDIKAAIGICLIITSILTVAYFFLPFEYSFYLTQLVMFLIIFSLVPLIIKKWEVYEQIARNVPIFISITIYLALTNTIFSFFDNEILVTLEIITRLGISFVLPFVILNLEYNIVTLQKYQMKDKYSHDLGQLLQNIMGRIYLIESGEDIKTNTDEISVINDKINDLLKLIRDL